MPRDPTESQISDRIRYEHMLQASKAVKRFVAGRHRDDLDADEMLRRATMHAIQEIGEAAARMSDSGRLLAPELPWGSIVQMRHIMIHVYWGVNLDRVWSVAVNNMSAIEQAASQALAKLPLPKPSDESNADG